MRTGRGEVVPIRLPDTIRAGDRELLDDAERERVERYARPADGARFAASRAAQRRILGHRFGVPPERIVLGRHPCPDCGSERHGPPRLVWPPVATAVSFSRAGNHALLALSPEGPVGVDLELLRPVALAGGLAERSLSPDEASYLRRLPPEQRDTAFLRAWVRKESVTKACGTGIVTDLRAVHTAPEVTGSVVVRTNDGAVSRAWEVADLSVGPGLIASVAWPLARTVAGRPPG